MLGEKKAVYREIKQSSRMQSRDHHINRHKSMIACNILKAVIINEIIQF